MFSNSLLVMAEAVQAEKIAEYRLRYLPGCDLTQSWVTTVDTLLRFSNTTMDRGMVLLEQACVFWFVDNPEALEMGARCEEKVVVLLPILQLCGVACTGGSCASTGCSCCRCRGPWSGWGRRSRRVSQHQHTLW